MSYIATWMDTEIVILSEISQTEKDKYRMICLYAQSIENNPKELIYKDETDSDLENEFMITSIEGYGEVQLGSLGLTCTHCYI